MSRALLSASAERNKEPIAGVLRAVLPPRGLVLEIASGTGQHVFHLARAFPALAWQPSEPDAQLRLSIAALAAEAGLANVRPPLELDVHARPWPLSRADAIVCINMIHIAPWSAAEALLAGAGQVLPEGGVLYLYGPYREGGMHTAPSNEAFDASLRARNPAWGVREREAVEALAAKHGLALEKRVAMPANNLSLVFRRG